MAKSKVVRKRKNSNPKKDPFFEAVAEIRKSLERLSRRRFL